MQCALLLVSLSKSDDLVEKKTNRVSQSQFHCEVYRTLSDLEQCTLKKKTQTNCMNCDR